MVVCPICQQAAVRLAGDVKTLNRANGIVIVTEYAHCEACNFGFNAQPPNQAQLSDYYKNNSQLRRCGMTPEEARHIASQVAFVLRYCKNSPQSLLEIGPDNGHFLDFLAQEAGASLTAFDEYNIQAAEVLHRRGYVDISSLPTDTKFDVVALRHVFEHVEDPLSYLQTLAGRIEDGVIFIEVPDCSAVGARPTDDFQFEHMSYFSMESMARLAQRAGLIIDAVEIVNTLGYSTTPNSVLRVILRRSRQDFYGRPKEWQGRLDETNEIFRAIENTLGSDPEKRIAIYGAGTITAGLVAYAEDRVNISQIFDVDQKKQGQVLLGRVVEDPDAINDEGFDAILLTVVGYEKEVVQFLRSRNVPLEKIIKLSELRSI
jgi:2-polyprenyl-3-methyl-5-hydroxy-6-metoxy-1,4-benzoquinol methylase